MTRKDTHSHNNATASNNSLRRLAHKTTVTLDTLCPHLTPAQGADFRPARPARTEPRYSSGANSLHARRPNGERKGAHARGARGTLGDVVPGGRPAVDRSPCSESALSNGRAAAAAETSGSAREGSVRRRGRVLTAAM